MSRRSGLIVLLLTLIAAGTFWYLTNSPWQYNYTPAPAEGVDAVAKRVAELVAVPDNESPTVITVANPQELRQWPLFRESQIGDKVLVYKKSGRIIVYNPTKDKIVAAGMVVSN
jgi:hypothetical protein